MNRSRLMFLYVGHFYDHLFVFLYPTVVLTLQAQFDRPYDELLLLATPGLLPLPVAPYQRAGSATAGAART